MKGSQAVRIDMAPKNLRCGYERDMSTRGQWLASGPERAVTIRPVLIGRDGGIRTHGPLTPSQEMAKFDEID